MQKVSDKVEAILTEHKDARSDDKLLLYHYYNDIHGLTNLSEIAKASCPSFESITRARRKIQAEGRLLATDETIEARWFEEGEYRREYGGGR